MERGKKFVKCQISNLRCRKFKCESKDFYQIPVLPANLTLSWSKSHTVILLLLLLFCANIWKESSWKILEKFINIFPTLQRSEAKVCFAADREKFNNL